MIRRPPRSTQSRSSAASDVYKRQAEALHQELEDFVAQGLNQLDQRSRDILLLSVVEGKSYSEIADILMVAVNSVGPSVSRAKSKLRNLREAKPAQRSAL